MRRRTPILLIIVAIVALSLVGGGAYYLGRASGPSATPTSPPPPTAPSEQTLEVAMHWQTVPTSPPSKPTPTVPPGAYLFRTAAGGLVANRPPAAAATPLPWTAYSDAQDGFSLHAPSGWSQQSAAVQGHLLLTLSPPGSDPTANVPGGAPGISIGWTASLPSISPRDSAYTDLGAVHAGAVRGHLFSIGGPMGYVITAAFPRHGGYIVLSADAQSDLLLDAFGQMLSSLTFTS